MTRNIATHKLQPPAAVTVTVVYLTDVQCYLQHKVKDGPCNLERVAKLTLKISRSSQLMLLIQSRGPTSKKSTCKQNSYEISWSSLLHVLPYLSFAEAECNQLHHWSFALHTIKSKFRQQLLHADLQSQVSAY